jgi:hypothetical protein
VLDPSAITLGDICTQALKESGHTSLGQVPPADDVDDAWFRLQTMLQQWAIKRWFVYHLITLNFTSTGALSYTVGPGGNFDTNQGGLTPNSQRPNRIERAFLRQFSIPGGGSPLVLNVDFPLTLIQSMEDYSRIRLKSLVSFPNYAFYDPALPLGNLFIWPVPNPAIYAVFIVMKERFQRNFLVKGLATVLNFPDEYYGAILYNLAIRLRSRWQIPTFPGDPLPILAKEGEEVLRRGNFAVSQLQMPKDLGNAANSYNIFGDTNF